MKYLSWMIIIFAIVGCSDNESYKQEIEKQIDSTTVSTSYFLRTVVHDEHLFLISRYGGLIHHPNCPCLTSKIEKEEQKSTTVPPIIIDLLNR